MSETMQIFDATIRASVDDAASAALAALEMGATAAATAADGAGDAIERLNRVGHAISEGMDLAADSVDLLNEQMNMGKAQAKDYGDALKIALEGQELGFSQILSSAKVAFRALDDTRGDFVGGIKVLIDTAHNAARALKMEGVIPVFEKIKNVSDRAFKFVRDLRIGVPSATRDMINLAKSAADVSANIRIQRVAWQQMQKDQTVMLQEAVRLWTQLQVAIANDAEEVDILGQKLNAALRPELFKMMGIQEFQLDLSRTAESANQNAAAFDNMGQRLLIMTKIQKPALGRLTSTFESLSNEAKRYAAQMEQGAKFSKVYFGNLKIRARRGANEMEKYLRLHGEIPEQMRRSFQLTLDNIEAVGVEQKRQEKIAKSQGEGFSRLGKIFGLFRGKVDETANSMRRYKAETRQANMANRQLMQFVKPAGVINTGITHIGGRVTDTSRQVSQFSMSLGSIVGVAGAVGGALGQLDPAFSAIIVGGAKMADQMVRSFSAMMAVSGTAADKIKASMGIISNSLMAFGLMATATIVKTGLLGAEVKTLEITMTQIARNLAKEAGGDIQKFTGYVEDMRDKIIKAGITTREATKAMSSFLRARLPVERVGELADAAKNLGVTVANMSSSEVFGRFIYFIQSGNSALLKAIGISKTAAQMYEEYGLTIDKAGTTLNNQEKIMARIFGLIQETTTVQGVYNEAMKTAGKQLSSMKRLFEEAMLTIGERFEPALAKVIIGMNKLLKWFNELDPAVHDQIANIIKWTAIIGTATGAVIALIPALQALIPLILLLVKKLLIASPVLLAVAAGIAAIVAVVRGLKKLWDKNFAGIQNAVMVLVSTLKKELAPVLDLIRELWTMLGVEVAQVLRGVEERLQPLIQWLRNNIVEIKRRVQVFAFHLKMIAYGLFFFFRDVLNALSSLIKGNFEMAQKHAKKALTNLLTTLVYIFQNWMEDLIVKAATWGWNLITTWADGMARAAQNVIVKLFEWLGNLIGNFLAPGSAPKQGPLSHIIEWGRGIMETFLRAFGLADFKILKDVMSPIQKAFEDAVAAGSLDEKQMIPMIRGARRAVADLISDFRKTGEINMELFGNIAKQLGEGGRDIMEYIRLTLQHQKALTNLAKVREEVVAAARAGFVSRELKDRLKAAEEEAEKTKEAVEWQKAFLDAQQDTVNLQLKQLQILERIAEKMGKAKKGKDEDKFEFELPNMDDLANADNIFEQVKTQLGGVSKEFLELRRKVQAFLDLPLNEKFKVLLDYLLELAGFEFPEQWEDMSLADRISYLINYTLQQLGKKKDEWIRSLKNRIQLWWAESLDKWGIDMRDENADSLQEQIWQVFLLVLEKLGEKIDEAAEGIQTWWADVWDKFLEKIGEKQHRATLAERIKGWFTDLINDWLRKHDIVAETEAAKIGALFGVILGKFFAKLITTVGEVAVGFLIWYGQVMVEFFNLVTHPLQLVEFAKQILGMYLGIWGKFIEFLVDLNSKLGDQLMQWLKGLIIGFIQGVASEIERDPDSWLAGLGKLGGAIIDKVISSIKDNWWRVQEAWKALLALLVSPLPGSEPKDPKSPLRGLRARGAAIAMNLAKGFNSVDLPSMMSANLQGVSAQLSGVGGIANNSNYTFQDGAFAGAFPNVRTAGDAEGIMGEINGMVDRSRSKSYVGAA